MSKDWDDELGKEITEDHVAGAVNVMKLRVMARDFLNMVLGGFSSILGGFLK